MIQTEGIFVDGSAISAPIIGEDFNWSGGDGTYQVLDDGGGNWRIKFLSSGTFTPLKNMVIDVFLVGGGGGAGSSYCGEGGAGYTTTVRSVVLTANTAYSIVVGAAGTNGNPSSAGGETTAFTAPAARAALAMLALSPQQQAAQTAATARPVPPRAARGRALPPANSVKQTARCTLPAAAAT